MKRQNENTESEIDRGRQIKREKVREYKSSRYHSISTSSSRTLIHCGQTEKYVLERFQSFTSCLVSVRSYLLCRLSPFDLCSTVIVIGLSNEFTRDSDAVSWNRFLWCAPHLPWRWRIPRIYRGRHGSVPAAPCSEGGPAPLQVSGTRRKADPRVPLSVRRSSRARWARLSGHSSAEFGATVPPRLPLSTGTSRSLPPHQITETHRCRFDLTEAGRATEKVRPFMITLLGEARVLVRTTVQDEEEQSGGGGGDLRPFYDLENDAT